MQDRAFKRHGIVSLARAISNRSLSRYDLVLAVVPLSFALAIFAETALTIAPQKALFASALIAGLALLDGLFRHPPTGSKR